MKQPPRAPYDSSEKLMFHVQRWLDNEDLTRDPVPEQVGWQQVQLNERYGWHFYVSSSTNKSAIVAFRRPGDWYSNRAVVDAWKIVGPLPQGYGELAYWGRSDLNTAKGTEPSKRPEHPEDIPPK